MQFPESWLRDFCNPPLSTQQLAELLTMSGMEVEELKPVVPPFSRVVVGEILEAVQHPNADRLRVCKVDAGEHSKEGPLQIVCGAPNARAGIRVPLALVGAELPPSEEGGAPFSIKLGKLRGVESQGMLCSAKELHVSSESAGLLELAADAPIGRDVREVLNLDDTLFTLKLTPNLAHGLSVYGVAREVAALTGAPLKTPALVPVKPLHDQRLAVRVEAPELCGRFSGRIVRNVNTKASTPQWMIERLERCGQRSVSPLVDISNYVMFEMGQPSHIFDLDKIHGGLAVRWAKKGETLKLLNGSTVELDDNVGVIADTQAVESLAGIMGGDATAVSDDTRNIYIEAAFWWPESVAGRSRRFNFSTDAGHRFERGVDPSRTLECIERITQLVLDICGGEAGPTDDQTGRLPERKPVTLRLERASKIIGMPIAQAQAADVLRRLGLQVSEQPGKLVATPPSWRFDLQIEEDLIEEVIRVVGYDSLPETPPVAPVNARVRPEGSRSMHTVRHVLARLGYQETINFSFVEERWETELAGNTDPIRLLNPIAAPLSVMRSSLVGGLISVLRYNLARRASRVRVFEVGRVFRRAPQARDGEFAVAGVEQPLRVGGLAYGDTDELQWGTPEKRVDFFDVKGDIEALFAPLCPQFKAASHPALHPGRSAEIWLNGRAVGFVGELHPKWKQAYELPSAPVVYEIEADTLAQRAVPRAVPIPRQQSVWRDIAVIVGEQVTHDALLSAITHDASSLVKSARLFDIYKPAATSATDIGAHERSLAVRIELRDDDNTLTDERIDATVAGILDTLKRDLGARLRG